MNVIANREETVRRVAAIPLPHKAKPHLPTSFGLIVPPSVFVVPRGWEWVHNSPQASFGEFL